MHRRIGTDEQIVPKIRRDHEAEPTDSRHRFQGVRTVAPRNPWAPNPTRGELPTQREEVAPEPRRSRLRTLHGSVPPGSGQARPVL
jgi:hypothetical protein